MGKRIKKQQSTTVEAAELLARVRVTVEEVISQCHVDPAYREQLLKKIGCQLRGSDELGAKQYR